MEEINIFDKYVIDKRFKYIFILFELGFEVTLELRHDLNFNFQSRFEFVLVFLKVFVSNLGCSLVLYHFFHLNLDLTFIFLS